MSDLERREALAPESGWERLQTAFLEEAKAAEQDGSPFSGALERKKIFDLLLSCPGLISTGTILTLDGKKKEAELKRAPFLIEKAFFEVASDKEIEYVEKLSYGLHLLEAMVISPQELQEYQEGVISGKEVTLDKKTKEIAQELEKHFDFPPQLFLEIAPFHRYFQFLIKEGKARIEDEVAYVNERYGWRGEGEASAKWHYWDDKLAKLNFLWRAHVLGVISSEDFERMIETV